MCYKKYFEIVNRRGSFTHGWQLGWAPSYVVLFLIRSGTVLEPFQTAGVPERILNRSGTVLEP